MKKIETYKSKSVMIKHEKGEPKKVKSMEKKMGIKDLIKNKK